MHPDQVGQRERPAFGLEVQPLAPHHPFDTPRLKQLGSHPAQRGGRQSQLPGGHRQEPRGNGNQQKSHAGCSGNIEGPVHGGAPPPEIVVIHAGKVVVHQRVGMNGFDRRRHSSDAARAPTDGAVGPQNQRGTHPLSRRSESIGQRFTVAPTEVGPQVVRPVTQQGVDRLSGLDQQIGCLGGGAERGIRHRSW
jgi:hypothetical protein